MLEGVDFRRDILPKLQGLPLRGSAKTMGKSAPHDLRFKEGISSRKCGIGSRPRNLARSSRQTLSEAA